MTTLTRIQTRTNTLVQFYSDLPYSTRKMIVEKYQGTNITLLQNTVQFTPDLLTTTRTLVFTTPAACAEYMAEPLNQADAAARNAYCTANGITAIASVV